MAQNFIDSRREQGFLLPPDVRDWLPFDHLAWFVIDAVSDMDLSAAAPPPARSPPARRQRDPLLEHPLHRAASIAA
jgi:hypothetical protein